MIDFTMPHYSLVVGWIVFGGLGMIAVALGKLREEWQPYVIGGGLMFYPYFVPAGIGFWVIGVILTIALFTYRRF